MATSTYPATGGVVDNTSAASFIPEIWSDEIIAAYENSLVLAPTVKKVSMSGKKGDTVHVPSPTRGTANAKAENTAVTLQNAAESEIQIVIDKHYEYSRMIEDITDVQALASLRQFYTKDAGYALAKQVDDDLFLLGQWFGDGNGTAWAHANSYYVDGSNGIAAYAEDTVASTDLFTDVAFRELIKLMDDENTPMDGRKLAIPPSVRQTIMGIDRYQSSDFVDGTGVRTGALGNLYGVDIMLTTNAPVIEAAADNSASSGDTKACLLYHTDTMVLAEQLGVRSQTQYKQEFLSDLFTADTIYGVKECRPLEGFVLAVPA